MRPSLPLAKGTSSKRWLARQFRDPYVQQRMASPAQYRSRSAFKLLEMDDHYKFISRLPARTPTGHPRQRPRVIVDLGAAPGGWSQVIALKSGYTSHLQPRQDEPTDMQLYGLSQSAKLQRRGAWSDQLASAELEPSLSKRLTMTADGPLPAIIAVDLLRMLPIPGVHILQADFLSPSTTDLIRMLLPRPPDPNASPAACVDLLLSDMAANATGNPTVDVAHSLRICDAVACFAEQHLMVGSPTAPGGTLVLKYFMHPETQQFYRTFLLPSFRRVYHVKPPSSRAESAEGYWICVDWLGGPVQYPPPPIPTEPFQHNLPISRKRVK